MEHICENLRPQKFFQRVVSNMKILFTVVDLYVVAYPTEGIHKYFARITYSDTQCNNRLLIGSGGGVGPFSNMAPAGNVF